MLQAGSAFQCACCGVKCHDGPAGICGCGMTRARGKLKARGEALFRCVANPAPSHHSPAQIVIVFADDSAVAIGVPRLDPAPPATMQ